MFANPERAREKMRETSKMYARIITKTIQWDIYYMTFHSVTLLYDFCKFSSNKQFVYVILDRICHMRYSLPEQLSTIILD